MAGLTNALQLMGLGWYVILVVLLGFFLGRWIDSLTGLSPLFLIVGTGLGLLLAFLGTRQMIRQVLRTDQKERSD